MRVRIIILLIVLHVSWSPGFASGGPPPDDFQVRLSTHVHNYSLDAGSFIEALELVAKEFQIHMGIEWIMIPSATSKISMSWNDASEMEVIESIAKTQKGYSVSLRNGVVHVTCASLIPPRQDAGLVKIKSFEMSATSPAWASRQLRNQVKLVVSPKEPTEPDGKPHGSGSSFASTPGEPTVSVNLHDVTAEDVLDKVVEGSARYIWILTFSDDQTLTPTGFRRTRTLWNSFPIADPEQPAWDLFHWTDQIPAAAAGAK